MANLKIPAPFKISIPKCRVHKPLSTNNIYTVVKAKITCNDNWGNILLLENKGLKISSDHCLTGLYKISSAGYLF